MSESGERKEAMSAIIRYSLTKKLDDVNEFRFRKHYQSELKDPLLLDVVKFYYRLFCELQFQYYQGNRTQKDHLVILFTLLNIIEKNLEYIKKHSSSQFWKSALGVLRRLLVQQRKNHEFLETRYQETFDYILFSLA